MCIKTRQKCESMWSSHRSLSSDPIFPAIFLNIFPELQVSYPSCICFLHKGTGKWALPSAVRNFFPCFKSGFLESMKYSAWELLTLQLSYLDFFSLFSIQTLVQWFFLQSAKCLKEHCSSHPLWNWSRYCCCSQFLETPSPFTSWKLLTSIWVGLEI